MALIILEELDRVTTLGTITIGDRLGTQYVEHIFINGISYDSADRRFNIYAMHNTVSFIRFIIWKTYLHVLW